MSREKIMVINSRDRKAGTSSEFEIFFNDSSCQQVAKILIKEVYIPNQFQNITPENHRFEFIQTTAVFPTPQIVYIPIGQYNIDQLITALKTGIDAKLTSGTTVTITKSDILYNLKFTFSGSPIVGDNNVIIYYDNSTIRDIIGLDSTNLASTTIAMGNPYNLRTIDFVQIHSPQLAETHGLDGGVNGYISLLESVSMTSTGFGGIAYRQNNDDELASILYEQPRNLSRINIVLRDDLGNKLTLPSNCHITIMIKIYF